MGWMQARWRPAMLLIAWALAPPASALVSCFDVTDQIVSENVPVQVTPQIDGLVCGLVNSRLRFAVCGVRTGRKPSAIGCSDGCRHLASR